MPSAFCGLRVVFLGMWDREGWCEMWVRPIAPSESGNLFGRHCRSLNKGFKKCFTQCSVCNWPFLAFKLRTFFMSLQRLQTNCSVVYTYSSVLC